jgi:predicted Zn-dependent protease
VAACSYNPVLGRRQLILVPESQMAQLGAASWRAIRREETLSADPADQERLAQVAGRIVRAATGLHRAWDYAVFEGNAVNAFALPGGKIGIYTGMLDFVASDGELAAVVGHEVAHVMSRHGAERYSQYIAATGALTAAEIALAEAGGKHQRDVAAVLGAGATFGVILPYARQQELEADWLGVAYMRLAGFDPREALTFWRRMIAREARAAPTWLSTHPADEDRLRALERIVGGRPGLS